MNSQERHAAEEFVKEVRADSGVDLNSEFSAVIRGAADELDRYLEKGDLAGIFSVAYAFDKAAETLRGAASIAKAKVEIANQLEEELHEALKEDVSKLTKEKV